MNLQGCQCRSHALKGLCRQMKQFTRCIVLYRCSYSGQKTEEESYESCAICATSNHTPEPLGACAHGLLLSGGATPFENCSVLHSYSAAPCVHRKRKQQLLRS